DLLVEFVGEHLDRVIREGLRERGHLAEHHQLLDDLRYGHAQVLGDVLDGRSRVDPDQVGGLHRGGVDRRDRLVVGASASASPTRAAYRLVGRATLLTPRGLRVDHHTATPAGAAACWGALTRARVARRTHALARWLGGARSDTFLSCRAGICTWRG